MKNVGPW